MGKKRKGKRSEECSSSEEQEKRRRPEAETSGNEQEGIDRETESEIGRESTSNGETEAESELTFELDEYLTSKRIEAPIPMIAIKSCFEKIKDSSGKLPNESLQQMYYRKANHVNTLTKIVEVFMCKIESLVKEKEALEELLNQSANFNTKFEELERIVSKVADEQSGISRVPQSETTYAEKLKSPDTRIAVIRTTVPPRHVIAVYPKENSKIKSSEETKAALMSCMVPVKEKLKIRGVKGIANNGILIETTTKEDVTRVLENKKLNVAGLVAGPPAKKRPQIIIYDAPANISENDILYALRRQNLQGIEKKIVTEGIEISHKTGKKDSETTNWVLNVKSEIRNHLIKQGRVYIDWFSLKVKDYISVSRCYKCQGYGHVSKYCRMNKDTCGHCAIEGHTYNNCPNKNKDPKCINCKKRGREHEHSSRSPICPSYALALKTHISRIDYDSKIESQELTL